ncbi:hypothetical protein BGZ65_004365 [Modicella reniformis]|uniref:Uncharacterized protein n=1 Tax=Modicella reniformis TaxID=1440133 RepID=A0A9P6J5R1_9FUNG|nr:hypothetical protein BGZ65_004365 [Modicella reniformis]
MQRTNLSGSDMSLPTTSSTQASTSQRMRKEPSNDVPLHDTKPLSQTVSLLPSTVSATSTAMSSVSPHSRISLTADRVAYSDASSALESDLTTPTYSKPLAAIARVDLVISEANYLVVMKRVESTLNQAAESAVSGARKERDTIRSLIDRWSEMMCVHTKFHDDVNVMDEDLREIVGLLNSLLVTLEPMLVNHSRDLTISLKRLTCRDQNPEHMVAEWNSALRQPFEHLTSYSEWLQRIDAHSSFSKDCRTRLDSLIYKTSSVTDNNQSRNVFRRLSTIARMVTKRRPLGSNAQTSTTPNSPLNTEASAANSLAVEKPDHTIPSDSFLTTVDMSETVQDLEIASSDKAGSSPTNVYKQERKEQAIAAVSPPTGSASKQQQQQQQHRSSTSSSPETLQGRPMNTPSCVGQKGLAERESHKATLRSGASEVIQARANSLRSPVSVKKPSIEGLRKVPSRVNEKNNKPPVKSLIGFWEQAIVPDTLNA